MRAPKKARETLCETESRRQESQDLIPWFPRLVAGFSYVTFLCLCGSKCSAMFRACLTKEDVTMPLQKVMPHKIEGLDTVWFV